jgi:hypothetical protein
VGALNPRPNLKLRLVVWSTPALPIGAWIALAAGCGAGLSAAAAALALQTGPVYLRREVRREPRQPVESWQDPPKAAAPPPRIGISNGLWEARLTHMCPIGVVLDGLELASAPLSCPDSAGPFGSMGAR